MSLFEGRRWKREIISDKLAKSTTLTHRDMEAKAGVKFEWSISQDYGKNEVKLTEGQMAEVVAWYNAWVEGL